MNSSKDILSSPEGTLRWIARAVGLLSAVLWLSVIIFGAIAKEELWTLESTILAIFGVVSVLGRMMGLAD